MLSQLKRIVTPEIATAEDLKKDGPTFKWELKRIYPIGDVPA